MKPKLTIEALCKEAEKFAKAETNHHEPELYGVTDGKAVGTYLEHKFQKYLHKNYEYVEGSSASGIDFPELMVDMKVTSDTQPQSSCPFKSARQKIFGLGYSLLIFVYTKTDDSENKTGNLTINDTVFIEASRTSDFTTTSGLRDIVENGGSKADVLAYFEERSLPVSEFEANQLAEEVLSDPPKIGYITISNALQWRLQYRRAIRKAGEIENIIQVS